MEYVYSFIHAAAVARVVQNKPPPENDKQRPESHGAWALAMALLCQNPLLWLCAVQCARARQQREREAREGRQIRRRRKRMRMPLPFFCSCKCNNILGSSAVCLVHSLCHQPPDPDLSTLTFSCDVHELPLREQTTSDPSLNERYPVADEVISGRQFSRPRSSPV